MTTIPPLYLFKGDTLKKRLLVYFYTHPASEHYLREIALLLNVDAANLSRELNALEREGMFQSQVKGNLKFFSLNRRYPLYEEMRAVVGKITSVGVAPRAKERARVYVIAGPNGVGKTTFAKTFLPEYLGCKTFVNADLIAGGLAPLAPDQAALKAGKLLLDEIRSTAHRGVDFGFETTLAGRSYVNLFRELTGAGYGIHLFFLWVPNVQIAIKRIRERIRRGGHHIPHEVARRRFKRGLRNLFKLYESLLTSWIIFDNSAATPISIAYREGGRQTVLAETAYAQIRKAAGAT